MVIDSRKVKRGGDRDGEMNCMDSGREFSIEYMERCMGVEGISGYLWLDR